MHGGALSLRLDDDVLCRTGAPPLAGFQHVIGSVATAREPDTAVDHSDFTGPRTHADGLARQQPQAGAVPGNTKVLLRMHHQSPIQWLLSLH